MKILIVEDQSDLRNILKKRLNEAGYVIDDAKDGLEALDFITYNNYDLIVLDIMIPKLNGLDLLKQIRNEKNATKVMLLTAKDSVDDRVKGLDYGADDYLVKPFAFEELEARIRSLLRRTDIEIQNILTLGDLTVNRTLKLVKRGDKETKLTKKEYLLLEYLMIHKDVVLSRERLESATSNYDYDGYSNVIDVYIRFLRKKIDNDQKTKLIHTIRGFGYVMRIEK
ncbi:response regulator transcription factor [Mariniplasma anaerobium]|uniref:DNA-binding response regulator n=1 Tax=Mariniplasma anaerobium TaxID=2735436 RepID=A0A7U9XUP6_9MOLU|nr:response regulator transcription factor [Mariniplasma anaerobium]BCR35758.1 DNA-binding response regulator [Mariniplasma anaerobium]